MRFRIAAMALLFFACGSSETPSTSPEPSTEYQQPLPSNPRCYTPCAESFVGADGNLVSCDAEGLAEGCLGDNRCVNGTCVPTVQALTAANSSALVAGDVCVVDEECGASLLCVGGYCQDICGVSDGSCNADSECPDFQVCIQGSCYSNCQTNDDCPLPGVCHRKACRLTCSTTGNRCPGGQACTPTDGSNGVCMASTKASGPPLPPAPTGTFRLVSFQAPDQELRSIEFSNVQVASAFIIVNDSPTPQLFTVRKAEHTEYAADDTPAVVSDNALQWIEMSVDGATVQGEHLEVLVEGTQSPNDNFAVVRLSGARNENYARWAGRVDVTHRSLGTQPVYLSYRETPRGRWVGSMYYFTNFSVPGLEEWASLDSEQQLQTAEFTKVKNAFVQQWVGFKRGQNFSRSRFDAMVTATIEESYRWSLMDEYCPEPNRRCYPFDNTQGYFEYTSNDVEFPVPSGIVELPIALDIKPDSVAGQGGGTSWSGRIATDIALHYAGDPKVELEFATDPTSCPENLGGATLCQLDNFQAKIAVGGRYYPDAADTDCAKGAGDPGAYVRVGTPWLVPGFLDGTEDDGGGGRLRYECRDSTLPFGEGSAQDNTLLSTSNPIPDGRARRRTLRMLDGFLVNQQTLVILFEETVHSFLGDADSDFSGYGFMALSRVAVDLAESDFEGSVQQDDNVQTEDLLNVSCNEELVQQALDREEPPVTAEDYRRLANFVLGRQDPFTNPPDILPFEDEEAHYLCHDTGLFDGGYLGGTASVQTVPCPAESRVSFFTLRGYPGDLRGHSCGRDFEPGLGGFGNPARPGECEEALATGDFAGAELRTGAIYECIDPALEYCDVDRSDLLRGKRFFAAPVVGIQLEPLAIAADEAFRYKSRFRTRSGRNVGFAPVICGAGTEYCYDPAAIESVRRRLDCLTSVYVERYDLLAGPAAEETGDDRPYSDLLASLQSGLRFHSSFRQINDPILGFTQTVDGFERLYSELLIVLGDEAYTSAFNARFDLANSSLRSFQGTAFEGPEGIDLSGGAGYEMYVLYQAAQYYQLALDRFYRLTPLMWKSLDLPAGFVSNETVTSYFGRVIRASTQKARAFGEIARRYQGFNRPELARRVALRAYTASYLESIVVSNLIEKLRARSAIQRTPELSVELERSARRYRSALLDMQDIFRSITDDQTLFGFSPDYIPFPPLGVLETVETSAFEKLLESAIDKASGAAEKEQDALSERREYDTDAAAFQNELTSIRLDHENQISEICGTFVGDDGRVYPATVEYAALSEATRALQNPCGRVGVGAIYEARVRADIAATALRQATNGADDILERVKIEKERVSALCDEIHYTMTAKIGFQEVSFGLDQFVMTLEGVKSAAQERLTAFYRRGLLSKCEMFGCAQSIGLGVAYTAFDKGAAIVSGALDAKIRLARIAQRQLEIAHGAWETSRECTYAQVESNAAVDTMMVDMANQNLEILIKNKEVALAGAEVAQLLNEATRLVQQKAETEELLVNLEAARNDPNVRIYKNDAILNAERTFRSAVKEAYKATRVFEYYTSQSYDRLDDLFLVRMVQRGDPSLESYLARLQETFADFRDSFGNPDARVAIISVRDDVLHIPRVNAATNTALCESDRVAFFRKGLQNPALLDDRGYITLDFGTMLDKLSPLTRNHKIYYVEAEFVGSDVGDDLGRVYLTPRGTSTVRTVGDEKVFYDFPKRTAVINTFFNGQWGVYDNTRVTDIYANFRLRDLPLVNSGWQLVINTKDEQVNKDINLNSLSDVRLYIYYSDFTEL